MILFKGKLYDTNASVLGLTLTEYIFTIEKCGDTGKDRAALYWTCVRYCRVHLVELHLARYLKHSIHLS